MPKAMWNGVVLAESDGTELVEGNHYFPPDSIHREYFRESEKETKCPWKGVACYYNIVVDAEVNTDAAWYYPAPLNTAKNIQDHVAFWKGVTVEDT